MGVKSEDDGVTERRNTFRNKKSPNKLVSFAKKIIKVCKLFKW